MAKRKVQSGAVLLVLALNGYATRAFAENPAIAKIRAQYASINREQKQYARVETDLEGYASEGALLTAHYSHGQLRKLTLHYFGETRQGIEEYYFWDHRLIFVLDTTLLYDRPLGEVKERWQDRFYFSNGKLIRWTGKKREPSREPTVEQQVRRLLQSARKFSTVAAEARRHKNS